MTYSIEVLRLLEKGIKGNLKDYWDYSFELMSILGENEEFADGLIRENEDLYDLLNDFDLIYFCETHDTNDTKGFIEFLKPYYEQAKKLVR
ncbi:hypothetical protein [Tuanshanicoccus lijuaniae]|uniref:hypothetical protein n=1 Tax=Aerococcaceae bacterium zg-1292 TaxID=2774330 RepID=UPI001BD81746|nr:hypothetical protein [Aerococcaceae bacterium zg-A91]MBS4458178.1 hypothetical protein [Aerococcaceae bacterium zg-BR33]